MTTNQIPDFPSRRDLHSSDSSTPSNPSRRPLVDDSLSSLLRSDEFSTPSDIPVDTPVSVADSLPTLSESSSLETVLDTTSDYSHKADKGTKGLNPILSLEFWTTPRIICASLLTLVLLIEGILAFNGWIGLPSQALETQSYRGCSLLAPLGLSFLATSATLDGNDVKLWSYSPTEIVSTSGETFSVSSYNLGTPLYDTAWYAVVLNTVVALVILVLTLLPTLHYFTSSPGSYGDVLGFLPPEDKE